MFAGERESRGHHVLSGPVDAGLGVRPLAHAQGLLHQVVQEPAGRITFGRDGVRVAELAENLRLADDHRVETRGDPERVPGRIRLEMYV